jgi:hypothetical protein
VNSTATANYIKMANETYCDSWPLSLTDRTEAVSGFYLSEKNRTSLIRRTARGLCALMVSTAPTYVQPVIDDKGYETFIDFPSVTGFPAQEKQIEIPLQANNLKEIQSFFARYPDFVKCLKGLADKIPNEYRCSTVVEHYRDIEEGWEKLFLLVDSGLEDFNQIEELENSLYGALIEPLDQNFKEKIVLAVS